MIASGFERIHRSNLIGIGILPVFLPEGIFSNSLKIKPGDRIEMEANPDTLGPQANIPFSIVRKTGKIENYIGVAAIETNLETEILKIGGIISYIHNDIKEKRNKRGFDYE